MKTIKLITLIIVGMVLASCGGSKTVPITQTTPAKVEIESDKCVKLAMAKPATRAWGEGVNFRLSRASSYAELQARAQFARKIKQSIKTATSEDGYNYDKASTNMSEGAQVRDEGAKSNDFEDGIAEEVIANTAIIETSQFMNRDGSYQVFVCIEYQGDVANLATEITSKVQQRISDEERMKMNFEFDSYRKKVEERLKNYKMPQ